MTACAPLSRTALAADGERRLQVPSRPTTTRFSASKQLEGIWYAVDAQGRATAQVASVFRITANGHSVQEIMHPGTAHEMVNMYYRDGDDVRLTHYCAGGNQPTLRLVPAGKPDVYNLEFVDITNMLTIDDEHMHEGRYEWLGEDRLPARSA